MIETWHPDTDLLVDLVLGHAQADTTDRIMRHLSECRACRGLYDELQEGLEAVLPAAPETTAPAGFESGVLERLHPPQQTAPHTPKTRMALAAAAACLLGALIGGTGVYTYERGASEQTQSPAPEAEHTAELVTAGGETVGWAAAGYGAEGAVLILTVDGASAGASYTCLGVFDDQSTEVLAEWTIYQDETSIWVLEESADSLQRLELLDDSGDVWAQAEW